MRAVNAYVEGMRQKQKTQYTIRDVPEAADARLRETAAMEEISLNQAALQAMERGLGMGGQPVHYRSLRSLLNKPGEVDRASWAEALSQMDQVNPEDWK
ncbi:MAG: hypothetical protein NTZ01_01500 [Verrucomicrobia bacterium]|nr:hypothetical protein [Verrucomicrobiota bacterium]